MKALYSVAAAFLICASSAFAAVEQLDDFSIDLPDGWTFKKARGLPGFMSIYDPSEEHAINIRIERDREERVADVLKEGFDMKIEVHDGVAVARHDWGIAIAAKGADGAYLEIDVNTPLLQKAPQLIRSMKADPSSPELKPAFEKLASDSALQLLK